MSEANTIIAMMNMYEKVNGHLWFQIKAGPMFWEVFVGPEERIRNKSPCKKGNQCVIV
jgi:hypothetical protein